MATAEVLGLPIVSADSKFPSMTELVVISQECSRDVDSIPRERPALAVQTLPA
ncbi:MAG TPA: hypothetical protein VME46_16660 [Acidimicrobiales bacterium]|nr:hypothetical protein [Acidimicrobiales bacterium]